MGSAGCEASPLCVPRELGCHGNSIETAATTSEFRDFDPNRSVRVMGFEYAVTMVSSYDTSYPCENITHG